MPNTSLTVDLKKLTKQGGVVRTSPLVRPSREELEESTGTGGLGTGSQSNAGSGLNSPLTMAVTKVKIVSIPVPTGATSVDVEVVQKFKLTDSIGSEFDITVKDYP